MEDTSCSMTDIPPPDDARDILSFCLLASGSKGNAIYVSDGETALLFDKWGGEIMLILESLKIFFSFL